MTLPEHLRTVPCGFGCGYLARGEADLDEHESTCDTDPTRPDPAELPPARPVRSIPRRVLRPRPHGGDLR